MEHEKSASTAWPAVASRVVHRTNPPHAFVRLARLRVIAACRSLCAVAAGIALHLTTPRLFATTDDLPLSPTSIVASPHGDVLYVACATAGQVAVFDVARREVRQRIAVPAAPSGLALSRDGRQLFVTSAAPASTISVVDTCDARPALTIAAGYHAMAPVLSPDGGTLYLCNRFNHEVQFVDLATRETTRRVTVRREPVDMDVTPDGRWLLVANHLPHGPSDAAHVAAIVSVIDVTAGSVAKELPLPNGSSLLRGMAISPDGKFAAVSHLLGRFQLPTTQLDRGWVSTNALTLIDLSTLEVLNTVLLDDIDAGAANPWAVAWSPDGRYLVVTHAGTHELSVIDAPALLAALQALPKVLPPGTKPDYARASHIAADVPNDLSFLAKLRRRVKLPGKGPRAVALAGGTAFTANYFSDTLAAVDFAAATSRAVSLPLGPAPVMSAVRRGELAWNDGTLAFQGWLSCSSCHSSDARVDGLNWDNLNDGIGNPKNAKSMVLAFQTPPTTALGVRPNAQASVRAGIRHILFTVQPEEVARDLDAFLSSLQPMPSPHLIEGERSPAARRGEKLFRSKRAGCTECHPPPLFTDLKSHDVGTRGPLDQPRDKFDVPTLIEVWRSAPYLHDGSATTIRDVLTTRNSKGRHGNAAELSGEEIDDLCAYVLSL